MRRHGRGLLGARFYGQVDLPRLREAGVGGAIWSITTNPLRRAARRAAVFRENLDRLARDLRARARRGRDLQDRRRLPRRARRRQARRLHRHPGRQRASTAIWRARRFDAEPLIKVTLVHLSTSSLGTTSAPRLGVGAGTATVSSRGRGREFVARARRATACSSTSRTSTGAASSTPSRCTTSSQPLLVSHTGIAGVTTHWRNVDDEQLRAVADTGGVVGIMYQSSFLGDPNSSGSAESIVAHLAAHRRRHRRGPRRARQRLGRRDRHAARHADLPRAAAARRAHARARLVARARAQDPRRQLLARARGAASMIGRAPVAMLALACLFVGGCAGDDTTIAMSFARASFYDAPFPSDDLRNADGTIDVSKFPNPNHVDIANQLLALVARDARGFSIAGGVFFRASTALDPASLPDVDGSIADGASVFLVGIDADGPDYLQRIPLDIAFNADGGPFGDRNLLALLADPRHPAPSAHPLRRRRHARRSRRARPPPRRRAPPMARPDYADALTTLAPLVAPAEVAGLAVFTTDDPSAQIGLVRDDAVAAHPLGLPTTPPSLMFDLRRLLRLPDDHRRCPSTSRAPRRTRHHGGDWLFDAQRQAHVRSHGESAHRLHDPARADAAGGWPTVRLRAHRRRRRRSARRSRRRDRSHVHDAGRAGHRSGDAARARRLRRRADRRPARRPPQHRPTATRTF